jgi:hypothetical protein
MGCELFMPIKKYFTSGGISSSTSSETVRTNHEKTPERAAQTGFKEGNDQMVNARTAGRNTTSEKIVTDLSDILRRKKRTVRHIEQALARYYQRQGLANSAVRFRRGEVNHG